MKKICLLISMLVFSTSSLAGAWYDNVTLEYVYSGKAGNRVAVKVADLTNIGGCGSSEMIFPDINDPYFKTMFSMILSARATGQSISLYSDGTCVSGFTGASLNDVRL